VLSLLEEVGYYPEPVGFAETFRKTITTPTSSCAWPRVRTVASWAWRLRPSATQLGLGGLLASLDELALAAGRPARRRAQAPPSDPGKGTRPRRGCAS